MNEPEQSLVRLAKRLAVATIPLELPRPEKPAVTLWEPPEPALGDLYRALIHDAELIAATAGLFRDGHYAEAVEEAFKLVNNEVKRRAGNPTDAAGQRLDGVNLMHQAFNKDRPMLRFNGLRTESEENEQDGYRFVFAGSMLGIRNPHAHGHNLDDEPQYALELLVLANHLLRMLARTRRVRRR